MNRRESLRETIAHSGVDTDRFINSGQGEAFINSYKLQIKYTDGMDPHVIKYWDNLGIKKEEHNADPRTLWFSYVPKEALEVGNTKKFPIIFNLPHTDFFNCEGRGYVELAARERLIVIIPTATDIEDLFHLYTKVVKMYPVDTSRFYMSGFSFTGFRTQAFAFRHPEVLAGIAFNCHLWPFIWELPEKWVVNHSASLKMPVINYVGNADFGLPLPIYKGFTDTHTIHGDDHVHTPQDNLNRANLWMQINGCREIPFDEVLKAESSENKCEREIGLPVTRSKIAIIDDTEYYFGDFVSRDGVYRTRIVVMDNVMHMPFGSMAAMTWEFLKHFSRNIKTGKSIIDGELPL